VSASDDNTVRIWDAKTGQQVGNPLVGHTYSVYSASFSPDGKYIVSASYDKIVRIWDAKTGLQVWNPLEGHTGYVYSASFSPDGRYIVSASYDKTVRIWKFPSLQELIDSTTEQFKDRPLTPEERRKYYLD
jgi:WD40 repeat protein